jgi:hypothetical protein
LRSKQYLSDWKNEHYSLGLKRYRNSSIPAARRVLQRFRDFDQISPAEDLEMVLRHMRIENCRRGVYAGELFLLLPPHLTISAVVSGIDGRLLAK